MSAVLLAVMNKNVQNPFRQKCRIATCSKMSGFVFQIRKAIIWVGASGFVAITLLFLGIAGVRWHIFNAIACQSSVSCQTSGNIRLHLKSSACIWNHLQAKRQDAISCLREWLPCSFDCRVFDCRSIPEFAFRLSVGSTYKSVRAADGDPPWSHRRDQF